MSDLDNTVPADLTQLSNKLSSCNKNVKTLMAILTEMNKKIDKIMETPITEDARKEKVQKILESRGVGRPSGSYEDKKKQYLKLLNEGKIKQPKPETLSYYEIEKDAEDKYVLKK